MALFWSPNLLETRSDRSDHLWSFRPCGSHLKLELSGSRGDVRPRTCLITCFYIYILYIYITQWIHMNLEIFQIFHDISTYNLLSHPQPYPADLTVEHPLVPGRWANPPSVGRKTSPCNAQRPYIGPEDARLRLGKSRDISYRIFPAIHEWCVNK